MLCLIVRHSPAFAQSKPGEDFSTRPIFVNVHLFQLEVPAGRDPDLTDQVFRMKNSSLNDHDKWMRALGKTYPSARIALLKVESRRVFRTSKPSLVNITRQIDGRSIVLEINGAQSPGDGVNPGTSLVNLVNLQFGNEQTIKPISYAITPLEVEDGLTYFYLVKSMMLNPGDYGKFFRPNQPATAFSNKNYYIVIGLSVEIDKTVTPARYFDERQSAKLVEQASKQVPLETDEELRKSGLSGLVRVRVEIGTDGKVGLANIAYSTVPEANAMAVAAARQWEFPAALFATDKNPITGFITFNVGAGKQP